MGHGVKEDTRPDVHTACHFLADYAVELFGSGATCIRMDKNVRRMARSLGMRAEFSILPRHIHLTVEAHHGEAATAVVALREMPLSFAKIALLSKLSWQMADGHVEFFCARKTLHLIAQTPGTDPRLLPVLVGLANASFCRIFNGDLVAMILVFVASMIGFMLKQFLSRHKVDFRITVIICSFISSLIAAVAFIIPIGTAPQIAVGTSVLYLVPGIPFINSFCDMLDRHYLCALGRAIHAGVICACLSIGLGLGMLLMHVNMF